MRPDLSQDLSDLPDAETPPAEPTPAPPSVADADLSRAADARLEEAEPPAAAEGEAISLGLGWLVTLALAGMALVFIARELHDHVVATFRFSEVFGWLNLMLLAVVLAGVGWVAGREAWGYRRLAQTRRLKETMALLEAAPGELGVEAAALRDMGDLLDRYETCPFAEARERAAGLRRALAAESDPMRWASAIEESVLGPMDDRIQQIIQREAVNVGLGTAISPYGFIDVIVALWRNLKLVRQVAEAYQGRPGLVGTFLVVRRALAAVALADLAHETSAMLVGAFRGLAFLSPIGQGLTNAALTVRLGLLVQAECRPLPMPPGKTRSAASLLLRSVPEQLRRLVRRREDKSNDAQPPADEAR